MTFDPAAVQVSYLMTAQVGEVKTEVTHRNRDNITHTHTHLVSHLSVSDETELFIHQHVARQLMMTSLMMEEYSDTQ